MYQNFTKPFTKMYQNFTIVSSPSPKCIKTLQHLLNHLDNGCHLPRCGGGAGGATDVILNPGQLTGHPANMIRKQGIDILAFLGGKNY